MPLETISEGIRRNVTFCEECDHVHMDTRKHHPAKWLCTQFKRIEGGSFVAPREWSRHQPFMYCIHINGGLCPQWVERRNGPVRGLDGTEHPF